jgi:1,4-alpha-glucan branching enzyme
MMNLSYLPQIKYQLGFPSPGLWRLRLNSDWIGYSRAFGNQECSDVNTSAASTQPDQTSFGPRDGFPCSGTINIGPYSVLVFSQDKQG